MSGTQDGLEPGAEQDAGAGRPAAGGDDAGELRAAIVAMHDQAALGSLAGSFSHGVNNRLTVVLSCLEMLKDSACLDPEAGRAVDLAFDSANRLVGDVRALLAGTHRQPVATQEVVMADAVSAAARTFVAIAGMSPSLRVAVPPGLRVVADFGQLRSALVRLFWLARRREAAAVEVTGFEWSVAARLPDQPMLRKGNYGCLDFGFAGKPLAARLLRPGSEHGNVLDRLLEEDGLEFAAVENFATRARGLLVADGAAGDATRLRLYLPRAS